ncbi:uracil phosphoribosyltransferase [Sphingobacterium spiritivorum]|uniref:Uracil phosphoribosyltransferase n=1 Tax=Sphingobacterium spiritivorum ATCC 33300 TaxID=525372 RepID=C2FX26_SPHSI|nr:MULTISPECIES: uracil phosphoribosyltransferase [Sphingobacterium]EEI92539.1 putative uracil phosphoribosyltransferase [Sphingobacterium spiritivorum ATCC 33300]QQS94030.1 uracil phosphoribosyltransferase [Sphingobacterium spiritivorum]QQT27221.1 uracil phosphoribosyltransferase [Sphingobacterium spiritivorum]
MVTILTKQNSIANQYIAELRDVKIQQDRMRFRRNLERIGEVMAYEISKTLEYRQHFVDTPLGVADTHVPSDYPVLGTIIRAGLPFHQGFLNVFDQADNAFIAAYRHTKKSGEFEIHKKYTNTPNLDDRVVIIADPMLATGRSLVLCCKDLLADYNIKELHIAVVIASEEGVQHVRAFLPEAQLWIGAVDNELTSKAYIVPGLGDAGDLAYGNKE